MFARTVSMRLKPNNIAEFNKALENEILPLLRKQTGFQDELVLVSTTGTDAVGISLWDLGFRREQFASGLSVKSFLQPRSAANGGFDKITSRSGYKTPMPAACRTTPGRYRRHLFGPPI